MNGDSMRFNPFPFPTHFDIFGEDNHATLVAWIPVPSTDAKNEQSRYSGTYVRAVVETLPGRFTILSVEHNDGYEVVSALDDLTYHDAIKQASNPAVGEHEFPGLG
jgi:hypothetical protein